MGRGLPGLCVCACKCVYLSCVPWSVYVCVCTWGGMFSGVWPCLCSILHVRVYMCICVIVCFPSIHVHVCIACVPQGCVCVCLDPLQQDASLPSVPFASRCFPASSLVPSVPVRAGDQLPPPSSLPAPPPGTSPGPSGSPLAFMTCLLFWGSMLINCKTPVHPQN